MNFSQCPANLAASDYCSIIVIVAIEALVCSYGLFEMGGLCSVEV